MTTLTSEATDLIERINVAVQEDDAETLHTSWFALYEIDPHHARMVAEVLRPLSGGF